jgi:hypothetical protein
MKRIGALLVAVALVAPAAPASAVEPGWATITRLDGARGQACQLPSSPDYPFHVLFRINARHVEAGWSKAILSYQRPTDTDWRVWIPTHKAQPGEVQAGLPGSADEKPKALRVRVRLQDGTHRFRQYAWDDLPACPAGAEPFPTRSTQG